MFLESMLIFFPISGEEDEVVKLTTPSNNWDMLQ